MDNPLPKILTFLTLFAIWGVGLTILPVSEENALNEPSGGQNREYISSLVVIQGNSLKGVSVPAGFKPETLASLMDRVIDCESKWRTDVWGDLDKPYPAYGIAQFQERTFLWMSEEAGFEGLEWKNPYDQIKIMKWAFENGYEHHWSCWRLLTN